MHNAPGRAVPLTWILLESQLTVDLIANPKILINIRKVQGKDAIRVHCNSRVKILDRVGDLPVYGTVLYKLTGITNIFSMSRAKSSTHSVSQGFLSPFLGGSLPYF